MGQDCSACNCNKQEAQSEFHMARETGSGLQPITRDDSSKAYSQNITDGKPKTGKATFQHPFYMCTSRFESIFSSSHFSDLQ